MIQIRQNLYLEQQQKLYMTAGLRQAISLLQMNSLELKEYVKKSIEENPFLDEEVSSCQDYEEDYNKNLSKEQIDEMLEGLNDYNSSLNWKENKENNQLQRCLSREPSLYEHLELQVNLELKNPMDKAIGYYLIGNIDSNGYLCVDLTGVSKELNVSVAKVEEVLKVIQTFNPIGVGARNLKECLLLQLKYIGRNNPLVEKIVQDYLEEIARKKLNKIAKKLSVKVQEVQEVYDLIRKLNPKPGLQYCDDRNVFIRPDATIIKNPDGYSVVVNDSDVSFLKINQNYVDLFRRSDSLSQDTRKYLEEKFESALSLIRGIEQRRINIYKVIECIVDIQSEFFEKGIDYLRPLTMSQVAEIVGVHESTVSRVTSNKYVQTPRGLYSLKFFFNSGVHSNNEGKVCSQSVKHLIKEIINNENPLKPLSDYEIMQELVNKGIKISRRTVNKYRQSLGIRPNMLRKRYC